MKSQAKTKLKQSPLAELVKSYQEKTHSLTQVLANLRSGQEKNLHAAANIRREIAIINTFITQAKLTPSKEKS